MSNVKKKCHTFCCQLANAHLSEPWWDRPQGPGRVLRFCHLRYLFLFVLCCTCCKCPGVGLCLRSCTCVTGDVGLFGFSGLTFRRDWMGTRSRTKWICEKNRKTVEFLWRELNNWQDMGSNAVSLAASNCAMPRGISCWKMSTLGAVSASWHSLGWRLWEKFARCLKKKRGRNLRSTKTCCKSRKNTMELRSRPKFSETAKVLWF